MKFEKPNMQTYFFLGGIAILWFIQSKNINPSDFLKIVSIPLFTIPFVLLGIFALTEIKNRVKRYYRKEQNKISQNIINLRKEQDKIGDIDKLIDLDREIMYIREGLRSVQSDRFEKNCVKSVIFFLFTLLILYFDLGTYLNFQSNALGVVAFLFGIYYLADMIKLLFVAFEK